MDDRLSKAMQKLGEALTTTVDAFGEFASAYYECIAGVLACVDWSAPLNTATALNDAPPRVRHLARYSKKGRTRKKNLRRALHKG